MTSQPDKLFREKLENFQRSAPAGAWNKLEKNLSKTDQKITWIRMAAGIALLTAAAIILWPAGEEKQRMAVKQDQPPVIKKAPAPQQASPDLKEEGKINKTNFVKTERTIPGKQIPLKPAVEENLQPVENSMITVLPEIALPEQEERVAEVRKPEEKEALSTTIVYTSAEVNAKFLKKKLPPQATQQPEDASHIQKLIGLAYAAKNSDTGLSDLRQKKDDILALNFGKKKGEN